MSKIINTTTNEEFNKLLAQSKYSPKPELPQNLPRLDMPMERPADKTTLAINKSMQKSVESDMAERVKTLQDQQSGLSSETVKALTQIAKEAPQEFTVSPPEEEEDDSYFYDEQGHKIRNIHNNRKRRKAIESRCSEMDILELIASGSIEQTVPIVPKQSDGKEFIVTYRSLSGRDNLLIQTIMAKNTSSADRLSVWYAIHKISMLRLAASIMKINGRSLPDIKGPDGKPDEQLLLSKFELISNYPIDILMDLDVNYTWFTERVKSLSVVDNITNF